ncbi:cytochrome c oxidase assembly factor 8-like [Penaeus chinensis]|uniref:cytochrome c oxidase assembly factor 8-like n=1 Tax=Penaeus chinensis TaxID=139456 RepID=UPI001FB6060B|nr:cytochrome c oxidase assembly factor 8-like [Penaeus chinensis]
MLRLGVTAPLKQTDRNLVLKCGFSSKLAKEGTGAAERGKEERREKQAKYNSLGVDPQEVKCDCIGPPDRQSNLRKVRYYVPPKETSLEQRYRETREATQDWNQSFWASHNAKFKQMKEEFVQLRLKEKYGSQATERRTLSADEMAVFYKQFLDDHRVVHQEYNREWYKKNANNILLAARVWMQQKGKSR